jgi:thiol-disulfide isomerase/thioredoxin
MKQLLLLFTFVLTVAQGNSQLASGTKLGSNIVATDINGKAVDIYADLAAGKSVVLDVFATWCGPCWGFHQTHYLKDLYEELGPDGTDQIRVYAIEADSRTPLNHLYQEVAGTSSVPSSLGDWTEDVPYSIVNSHEFNTALNIAYFPTLYIIRPDKTVLEVGEFRGNDAVWRKALLPKAEKDLIFTTSLEDRTFCTTSIFAQKPTIMNMGTTAINTVDLELKINGTSKLATVNTPIPVFGTAEVTFGNTTITQSTVVEVIIDAVDDVADEVDPISKLTAQVLRPVVTEDVIVVKYVTDFYPGEISWKLKDNKNRILKEEAYNPGPEAEGGGGDDANKEFTYEIPITKTDISCLTFALTDSYGDGTPYYGAGQPRPGVAFYKKDGTTVLKPYFNSDANYTNSKNIVTAADFTSGLEDASFVESFKIYPNPVSDFLNVDLKIKEGTDYDVFVTDLMGKNVTVMSKNASFLNVASLNAGVYFLNVRTSEGVYAHKFTKL